jgi:hypothetical protein
MASVKAVENEGVAWRVSMAALRRRALKMACISGVHDLGNR